MSDPDVLRAVTSQIDWWWRSIFRPRIADLSDAELLWEPVEGCWSLRPVDGGMSEADFHWPPPRPAPFTTIAWRLNHMGVGCLADRTSRYFPEHAPEPWPVVTHAKRTPFPVPATEAIAFLDRWWAGWRAGIGDLDHERLWEPLGDREGDFPEMQLGAADPFVHLVLHNHRELMHHGAEIALLRDLHLAHQPRDLFVTAVLAADRAALDELTREDAGVVDRYLRSRPDLVRRAAEADRPESIRLAVELGFDLDDRTDGVTALHHAVAGGHLDLVRTLVELGADCELGDSFSNATPADWARRFAQHDALALLEDPGAANA